MKSPLTGIGAHTDDVYMSGNRIVPGSELPYITHPRFCAIESKTQNMLLNLSSHFPIPPHFDKFDLRSESGHGLAY